MDKLNAFGPSPVAEWMIDAYLAGDPEKLPQLWQLCRATPGRMQLAAERGDRAAFVQSLRTVVTLESMMRSSGLGWMWFRGLGCGALVQTIVRRWLMSPGFDPAWLPDVQAELDRAMPIGPDLYLRAESLAARHRVAVFFSEPENARAGRFSLALANELGYSEKGRFEACRNGLRLGWFEENDSYLAAAADLLEPTLKASSFERPRGTLIPATRLALVQNFSSGAVASVGMMLDPIRADRAGTRVLMAIARYQADRGELPADLAALVPSYLGAVPLDPWSGQAMIYKRIDRAGDRYGRGFVLYCVGPDAADNGGAGGGHQWNKPGQDFIVNDPLR